MIDPRTFRQIKELQHDGLTAAQIARATDLDERTARKWMNESTCRRRPGRRRGSKLDPFKEQIRSLLERHEYTVVQIHRQISEAGYTGGMSILKEYVRRVRPPRRPAYLTLSFAPGECAQVDWGQFGSIAVGNTRRRLSFFVMTLCYSRYLFVKFTLSEKMEQWLSAHLDAFEFFGGVPERIMHDNLKCAVLDHPPGGPPQFHPRYQELAAHLGFTPVACGVRKPHHKGIVERDVGYIKTNLLRGLPMPQFPALGPLAREWLEQIANQRIHRSTGKKPAELFAAEERPALGTFPLNSFDPSLTIPVRANRQFRVAYDGNRYSVPSEYAGAALTAKIYAHRIVIYAEAGLIAEHSRSWSRGEDCADADHARELLRHRKRAHDQQHFRRFLTLSARADFYYQQLRLRRLNPLVHVRKIVALSDIYGPQKVGRALEDACAFEAFSSEYITNILEQQGRILPEPGALHLPHKEDLLELELPENDCSFYSLFDTHDTSDSPTPLQEHDHENDPS